MQPAACSSSGASCSKEENEDSEEVTTDEDEDSEDDEQWNSDDADNDKLSTCVLNIVSRVFFRFVCYSFCLQCLDVVGCIRPVETERWGTGMVICLEQGANDFHAPADATATPSSFTSVKSRIVYLLVPADLGCHGKKGC